MKLYLSGKFAFLEKPGLIDDSIVILDGSMNVYSSQISNGAACQQHCKGSPVVKTDTHSNANPRTEHFHPGSNAESSTQGVESKLRHSICLAHAPFATLFHRHTGPGRAFSLLKVVCWLHRQSWSL